MEKKEKKRKKNKIVLSSRIRRPKGHLLLNPKSAAIRKPRGAPRHLPERQPLAVAKRGTKNRTD